MIHILKHGQSYCEMPGVPRDWPEGHRYVSFEDDWQNNATCERCRTGATLDPAALRPITLGDIAAGVRNMADAPIPALTERYPTKGLS